MMIRTKRVYEAVSDTDGIRVRIDRIWPRGIAQKSAKIDCWAKDLAPSNELRVWYRRDNAKWPEFLRTYHAELEECQSKFQEFLTTVNSKVVTLVYASRETKLNNATAFKQYLEVHFRGKQG